MTRFGIQPSPGLADHGPGSGFRPERADTGGPYGRDVPGHGLSPEKHGLRQGGNPMSGETTFGRNTPTDGENGTSDGTLRQTENCPRTESSDQWGKCPFGGNTPTDGVLRWTENCPRMESAKGRENVLGRDLPRMEKTTEGENDPRTECSGGRENCPRTETADGREKRPEEIRRRRRKQSFGRNLPTSGENDPSEGTSRPVESTDGRNTPFGRSAPPKDGKTPLRRKRPDGGTVRTLRETVNLKTNCEYGQI